MLRILRLIVVKIITVNLEKFNVSPKSKIPQKMYDRKNNNSLIIKTLHSTSPFWGLSNIRLRAIYFTFGHVFE